MEMGGTANDSEQRSKRLQYMTEPDQQGRFRKIDYVLVFKDLEDDEDKETMQQYRDKFIENLKKQNLEMEITGKNYRRYYSNLTHDFMSLDAICPGQKQNIS